MKSTRLLRAVFLRLYWCSCLFCMVPYRQSSFLPSTTPTLWKVHATNTLLMSSFSQKVCGLHLLWRRMTTIRSRKKTLALAHSMPTTKLGVSENSQALRIHPFQHDPAKKLNFTPMANPVKIVSFGNQKRALKVISTCTIKSSSVSTSKKSKSKVIITQRRPVNLSYCLKDAILLNLMDIASPIMKSQTGSDANSLLFCKISNGLARKTFHMRTRWLQKLESSTFRSAHKPETK